MAKRLEFGIIFKSRQKGDLAIIVELFLIVLMGILGLVLDLEYLYVNKT